MRWLVLMALVACGGTGTGGTSSGTGADDTGADLVCVADIACCDYACMSEWEWQTTDFDCAECPPDNNPVPPGSCEPVDGVCQWVLED